ncbi:MAG: hypothetical protein IPO92_02195 [Saprospiraceae bacterium]|nr:hypothetical protein [Saprospiraceae bacterium]
MKEPVQNQRLLFKGIYKDAVTNTYIPANVNIIDLATGTKTFQILTINDGYFTISSITTGKNYASYRGK